MTSAPAPRVLSAQEILGQALTGAEPRDAVRGEILRQLAQRRPIAIVNGYWVTPISVSRVFDNPSVASAFTASGGSTVQLGQLREGFGFVFTHDQLASTMIGELVKDLTASIGVEALAGVRTDQGFLEAFWLGVDYSMAASMGPLSGPGWFERTFGVGDFSPPVRHGVAADDPGADPDDDGVPNWYDSDDDGDGTPDEDDAAPYDEDHSICDCGRGTPFADLSAISFSPTESRAQLRAVLSVFSAAKLTSNFSVPLGTVAGGSSLRLVFMR